MVTVEATVEPAGLNLACWLVLETTKLAREHHVDLDASTPRPNSVNSELNCTNKTTLGSAPG